MEQHVTAETRKSLLYPTREMNEKQLKCACTLIDNYLKPKFLKWSVSMYYLNRFISILGYKSYKSEHSLQKVVKNYINLINDNITKISEFFWH